MENRKIIRMEQVCISYGIEPDFLRSLQEFGLIELIEEEDDHFVDEEKLGDLEMVMHLHYDLEINLEGIEAISHLLTRVRMMQEEIKTLRNQLGQH